MMWDDDGDPTENYLAWPEAKLFISHSGSAAADIDYDVSNEEDICTNITMIVKF